MNEMSDLSDLAKREEIIRQCLEMNRSGLNQGTSGNISVRHGEGMLITPTSLPYDTLVPEDIVFVSMEGEVRGRHKPSSEWRFHRDILRERADVNAVVHAHPTYCTTLAIMNREIPSIHYMLAVVGGPNIRCAPYAIYGSEELSRNAVEALRDRKACLLEHHGMIAVGKSLAQAMWLAVEVETLARQYHGCLQIGEPRLLSERQIQDVIDKIAGYGHQG
ncbi:class II aldolase [Cereibacter sphaeroides]|jgi:L-fuculose-phosphate aldolase|nr:MULTISPECIES: class II aldolase/adducin family protein [Cereibacter]ABN76136.1 L-fuculose-phosphate aldolase [Cereibacter sphaeroides ATCC 17029]EKX56973.1 Ribulose-5-phosphate 4-epimerase [Rhodobacter sp. AKP1]RDS96246.1 class II aldolase [Cereibacter sphaeroides f. sp. denitrificans]ACM00536.1 L-fuculose-phosphate aldolase [Cereibacter sphaeroides KD131]AZB55837.1 class II aldolase [Cereibacter sphaeroides]